MLLILCVLPAGMSRSAWIAAAVSSAYIGCMHYREKVGVVLKRYGLPALLVAIIALVGIYQMKKDSADGRLFMWKVAAQAVCERPWTGYGWECVPAAYGQAIESAAEIYEDMKWNARFLFEYGHALHKSHQPQESNEILKEALKVSGDPIILNIIGKNEQEMKNYKSAEDWYMRAVHRLPGRIYPYYLLAHLYANSAFYHRDKLEHMGKIVLEKEPKVQSTAIRQMRRKVKELLKKVED